LQSLKPPEEEEDEAAANIGCNIHVHTILNLTKSKDSFQIPQKNPAMDLMEHQYLREGVRE
jgi:hypothetical protein